MNRLFRRAHVVFAAIPVAVLAAAVGLIIPAFSQSDCVTAGVGTGSPLGDEMIRVGLRYGPSAVNEITVYVSSGDLIARFVERPDGVIVPGGTVTVRAIPAGSRTERVYRLRVGEYTDPLGAEKRLAELSAHLGRPVARAVGVSGGYYVAYIGRSYDAAEMDELRIDLGLTSLESGIDARDLPYGMSLELTCGDGSPPIQVDGGHVVFASDAPDEVVFVGSPPEGYRGNIEVLLSPEGMLEVVNEVALEDYLRSAVGSEMSSYAPLEALKAQAVLMRTYAINHMIMSKHDRFHVCDTHHCQVYRGVSSESRSVSAAVELTSGEVLGIDGVAPVQVYYHATCGGLTESSGNVWGSSLPHLTSTLCSEAADGAQVDLSSDAAVEAFIESHRDDYCSEGSNYRWYRYLSEADLVRIARKPEIVGAQRSGASNDTDDARDPASEVVDLQDEPQSSLPEASVLVRSRTPAGRVTELEIVADGQRVVLVGDLQIRMALGDASLLPSCFFVIKPVSQGSNGIEPALYVLSGAGYGHGVGMCQAGAIGMAKRGYDYRHILAHYFSGASVVSR